MKFDVLGLLAACSYALDCVEAELIKVTNNHSKRVAYMAVCTAEKMGIQGQSLQDLAECALLHDNAVAQYIKLIPCARWPFPVRWKRTRKRRKPLWRSCRPYLVKKGRRPLLPVLLCCPTIRK